MMISSQFSVWLCRTGARRLKITSRHAMRAAACAHQFIIQRQCSKSGAQVGVVKYQLLIAHSTCSWKVVQVVQFAYGTFSRTEDDSNVVGIDHGVLTEESPLNSQTLFISCWQQLSVDFTKSLGYPTFINNWSNRKHIHQLRTNKNSVSQIPFCRILRYVHTSRA